MNKEHSPKERNVKLFKAQFDAFNFTTQFAAAVAGVQSGKTFLGAHWAGKKMMEFPTGNGIIVAPTYKILQAATMRKLFEVFPELQFCYKEQKGQIELPTGGIVYVRSADNPLGIEGITANWVWLDEGGMTSVLTWTVLRSRVSMTGGQVLITTTPYNMGWLYTDFYLNWKNGIDPNLSFFTWKSIENPFYPIEFYNAEKKRLIPQEFARRYMGEFQKMTGLVWDLPTEQIIEPLSKDIKTDARIMGVDWGYKNPAAMAVVYVRDNCFYIQDEWKLDERTTDEIIQVGNNLMREHRVTRTFPDPAEPDRIEEARRKGWPVYEADKDVFGGISHIQSLIREKRLFISNKCKATIDEFNSYHWLERKDETTPFKDEPEKFNDHLCDAIRYAIYSYGTSRREFGGATGPLKPYFVDLGL